MGKRLSLIVLAIVMSTLAAYAQPKLPTKLTDDKDAYNQYLDYCKAQFNNNNYKAVLTVAKKALNFTNLHKRPKVAQHFSYYMGVSFEANAQHDSAIRYFSLTEAIAATQATHEYVYKAQIGRSQVLEETGHPDSVEAIRLRMENELKTEKDEAQQVVIENHLAGICIDQNKYEQAIKMYLSVVRYYDKVNDPESAGTALVNVGNTYMQMSNQKMGILYSLMAIPKLSTYPYGQLVCWSNIGAAYTNLHKNDSAIYCYNKAIQMARQQKDDGAIFALYVKLSSVLIDKGDFARAQDYLDKGIAYGLSKNEMTVIIDGYTALGDLNDKKKFYAAALDNYKKALAYSLSSKHTEREEYLYDQMAKSAANGRFYEIAFTYQKKYQLLHDSLKKDNTDKNISALEITYQTEKKQQQINLLSQKEKADNAELQSQRRTRIFLIAGLALVLVIVGLTVRAYTLKQKANRIFAEKNTELETKNDQLKLLNDKLDEANQSKTKLFSILSHDLRAPIGSVFQFINLQKNHPHKMDAEEGRKHNDRILHSAENLMESMEDILIWSKSQMDSFSLNVTRVQVNELIDYTIAIHADFAEERKITLEKDCPQKLELFTDVNFLKIVLRNIVSNGIKFTPSGGHIIVSAGKEDERVYFKIHDSGVGMSKDQVRNLFEWSSIRSDTSGLGLKLAKEFITRLGGEIVVDSKTGEGTTFVILLPVMSNVAQG